MLYLAIGCGALALIVWASDGSRVIKDDRWRLLSGALALACFCGAAFVGLRGGWGKAIVLVMIGFWLVVSARRSGVRRARPSRPGPRDAMSLSEARSILGVEAGASAAEIKAAHSRLMRMAHPDKGGTAGLAAQLTAARDRLLGRGWLRPPAGEGKRRPNNKAPPAGRRG